MKIAIQNRVAVTFKRTMLFVAAGVLFSASLFTYLNQPTQAVEGDVPFVVSSEAEGQTVALGDHHMCAIGDDGLAYCWGGNHALKLLGSDINMSLLPRAVDTSGVLAGKTIKSIDVGYTHTCVIASNDRVYCWGGNEFGELGDGNVGVPSSLPVAVDMSGVLAGKTIKTLALGDSFTCVIASDDQVYCWGKNEFGRLGAGSDVQFAASPVAVDTTGVLNGKTVVALAVGDAHACAIGSDGQAYCWGWNGSNGILGTTNLYIPTPATAPVAVDTSGVLGGKTLVSISAGDGHTCVIALDGQAYCWGSNYNGEIGNGSTAQAQSPAAVDTSGVLVDKTLVSISAGGNYTCALASTGDMFCWGANWQGQLGNREVEQDSSVPVSVDSDGAFGTQQIVSIRTNSQTTCAVTVESFVYCWGSTMNSGITTQEVPYPSSISTPTQIMISFAINANGNVHGISFGEYNGMPIATVEGEGFGNTQDVLSRSLITLNDESIPFCSLYSGQSADSLIEYLGVDPALVSDSPPCYLVSNEEMELLYVDTSAVILLAPDFDITAPGAVSVNGSEPFAFNQPTTPPDDEDEDDSVTPTAGAEGKSLENKPTIAPRPTFSGKAEPNSTVVVTVHSDPVTCTTTADNNGNWSCTLDANLPAGQHTVYVQITSPTNVITNLGPYEVTVDGQNPTVVAPNTGFFTQMLHSQPAHHAQQSNTSGLWIAMAAGAALGLVVSMALYLPVRNRSARR